jgi:hypothetical protein
VTFEASAIQYRLGWLQDCMIDVDLAVSTQALSLQPLTLAADFKFVREFLYVSDAN